MNAGARHEQITDLREPTPEQDAAIKAAGGWVAQFARTLKTCRLYDSGNPTAQRFRQELAGSLARILDEHGAMALRFTADDVQCEGVSLYPARSRDDNLALPFYRDGVRGLTFSPGIEPREVEVLIDAVIQVTSQNQADDDLVTLLWQAHLNGIDVDYVPAEGDMGSGEVAGGEVAPWPSGSGEDAEDASRPVEVSLAEEEGSGARSDDWSIGESTIEIEAGFEELQTLAPLEVERFRRDFESEHLLPVETASVAVAHAYLAAGADAEGRLELARFLARVLRQSLVHGSWREAYKALALIQTCGPDEWSPEMLAQELLQPISISSMKERLEQQDPEAVADFIAFAGELGEPGIDVLNQVCAELESSRHQRQLAETITERCRATPERLAPWLADRRWSVVRNTLQILRAIGGNSIVGLLQGAIDHPEPRVRYEVIAALGQVDAGVARPILLRMLQDADTRTFCSVLHLLSDSHDPALAAMLLDFLKHPEFEKRPQAEKRSIYSALSAVGGDVVLPELEAELHRGNWFSGPQEAHRQAVARCVARIGTPQAKTILERGLQSRRAPVRKACEDALARLDARE